MVGWFLTEEFMSNNVFWWVILLHLVALNSGLDGSTGFGSTGFGSTGCPLWTSGFDLLASCNKQWYDSIKPHIMLQQTETLQCIQSHFSDDIL